jgi:hypothetical protein
LISVATTSPVEAKATPPPAIRVLKGSPEVAVGLPLIWQRFPPRQVEQGQGPMTFRVMDFGDGSSTPEAGVLQSSQGMSGRGLRGNGRGSKLDFSSRRILLSLRDSLHDCPGSAGWPLYRERHLHPPIL